MTTTIYETDLLNLDTQVVACGNCGGEDHRAFMLDQGADWLCLTCDAEFHQQWLETCRSF